MNILFIGDIMGRPGRTIVKQLAPKMRDQYQLDLVVANAENAHHGKGISLGIYEELRSAGVDWLTSGDHIWNVKEFMPELDNPKIQALRPANYPAGVPGRGLVSFEVGHESVTLINLQGRVFMNANLDNPFLVADSLLLKSKGFILIDFHAETTSEKNTFGHYVDGRAGAVVGTHTHVQTADERLLPQGTAYISDVGMTGPMEGSIGADLDYVTPSFTKGLPFRLEPAEGPGQFNAVLLKVENDKAQSITRIFECEE
ncbi:TIGR00282 family metallophosphoesterase [Candidatus Berkelbacteria bacterium]|nr:TIGR00282 family metallophosphoesterase [Candidatus Berkelbacteria bacterium]